MKIPSRPTVLTESGLSLEFGYQKINNAVRDVWTAGRLKGELREACCLLSGEASILGGVGIRLVFEGGASLRVIGYRDSNLCSTQGELG